MTAYEALSVFSVAFGLAAFVLSIMYATGGAHPADDEKLAKGVNQLVKRERSYLGQLETVMVWLFSFAGMIEFACGVLLFLAESALLGAILLLTASVSVLVVVSIRALSQRRQQYHVIVAAIKEK